MENGSKNPKDYAGEIGSSNIKTFVARSICTNCGKTADAMSEFPQFIVCIIRGRAADNGEPLVRDGIFDEKGKLARMFACPQCAVHLKRFYNLKNLKSIKRIPEGKVKTLLFNIYFRQRGNLDGLCLS